MAPVPEKKTSVPEKKATKIKDLPPKVKDDAATEIKGGGVGPCWKPRAEK